MRTFTAPAQAAMDSGNFEAYLLAGFSDTDPDQPEAWAQPVSYKLKNTTLEVVVPATTQYAEAGNYVVLRRGVILSGTPEYTTTSSFYITDAPKDAVFTYIKAQLLVSEKNNLGPNITFQDVINNITMQGLRSIKASYEFPSDDVWLYQFIQTGKDVIIPNIQRIFDILRQKYLIYARHTEHTFTADKIDIYFYQPTKSRAVDYTIEDRLFLHPDGFSFKKFAWKDETGTVHTYLPPAYGALDFPLHNLGYLEATSDPPTWERPYRNGKSSKLPANLKYESGDYVTITTSYATFSTRINVTEIFDTKSSPSWYVIIEPINWFEETEAGALPNAQSAAFTQLSTQNFNNNLDSSVNNLQALAEAVDDLSISGYTPPATTAANDFQVGDGLGAWVKKTLAQTITILRTSLDTIYQALDSDLTAIAALSPSNDDIIQRKSGAWTNRTLAQLSTDMTELTQDIVGAMFSGNTEIGAAVAYQDSDGTIDVETDTTEYTISVSVASNNLTVALKDKSGSDPSATSPVKVKIGGTLRSVTAALSVTANAGTLWFNAGSAELATQLINYFAYLGYNATDGVVIGFSRIPNARFYSDFSATSTNETFCKISTITTAASTDDYTVIGRFSATLSAGAGYTWSISGTGDVINRPIYTTDLLTYSPQWTSTGTAPSVGNGTLLGYYQRVYNRTMAQARLASGSTTGWGTGTYNFSLPFSSAAITSQQNTASVFDNSASTFYLGNTSLNATAGTFRIVTHASGNIAATSPITFATSDVIFGYCNYA
jgi:hypothetical protein